MARLDDPLDELQHAYRVMDVPPSATVHLIRQRHRQLLKRWHPDLYQQGTPQHGEANQMSKVINEAYSRIRFAPLRYGPEPGAQWVEAVPVDRTSSGDPAPDEVYPRLDRIEFWVRFVCGGLLGILVGLSFLVYTYVLRLPDWLEILICLGVIFGAAFASARWGDEFWYAIFRRRWLKP